MRLALTALAAALSLAPAAAPAQQAAPLTAQAIFDAAFRRLQSYPLPPYAVWTATWRIEQRPMGYYTKTTSAVEVHRYAVRLADGMENASDPSDDGKLPPALIGPEFLGPFAWTFRSSVHIAPHGGTGLQPDVTGLQPDVTGLQTIATVVAMAKPAYALAAQTPGPDGTYHLRLHPYDDPQRHNLRDLWIDPQTFDLVRAHFTGTYRPNPAAPGSPTEVTVSFKNVLGCWVVSNAIWTYDDSPFSYTFDVLTNEIALPKSLPDWIFDAGEYRRHREAGEPDYLGALLEQMRHS